MNSVFEQIKQRLPITEVLSSYLTLEPAGTQFKAKCPFHNERTASFSVSPDRGVYYCFGCGAKGDIFDFVERFEGVDAKGALTILANRAGIVLAASDNTQTDYDPVYEALEYATSQYESNLQKNPEALAYLKKRGLTEETIAAFRLGYAPSEWRYLASTLGESNQLIYERAGLIKKTDKGYYDRFRGRIMFPMMDGVGRVVAFSGRMFPDTPEGPKYLNSPETEVFQKSRILYGFDKAKTHIKKHNFAILVEGQMDMVLSHQAGFCNTVATSGTAVSDASIGDSGAQLSVLARLTPNLFLAFDGDSAGEKAIARAAVVALALGLNPKVVPLPVGVDPADYIAKEGADAWKELLKKSTHFILYELALVRRDAQSPNAIVRLMKERMFPFLARIPSPMERTMHLETIANELRITSADIAAELAQYIHTQKIEENIAVKEEYKKESVGLIERFLVLAERYPSESIAATTAKLHTLAFEDQMFKIPMIDPSQSAALISLIERDYGSLDSSVRDALAQELFAKIEQSFFADIRAAYTKELSDAERAGDDAKAIELLTKLHQLNQRRQVT